VGDFANAVKAKQGSLEALFSVILLPLSRTAKDGVGDFVNAVKAKQGSLEAPW
jgi:hypothetical protein